MVLRDFLPDSEPRLANLASCEDWLAHAALAGMPHACSALLTLLEEIEVHPPRHSAYLQILERLRYPVLHAETEQTKGFAGKPLPLDHSEGVAFVQANGLWVAMLRAYGRLLSAALNGKHPELEPSLPRLFQRVLVCAGETIGTCLLDVGETLGLGPGVTDAVRLMSGTRMGVYEHAGARGGRITIPSAAASSDSIELSCAGNGVATKPLPLRSIRARK